MYRRLPCLLLLARSPPPLLESSDASLARALAPRDLADPLVLLAPPAQGLQPLVPSVRRQCFIAPLALAAPLLGSPACYTDVHRHMQQSRLGSFWTHTVPDRVAYLTAVGDSPVSITSTGDTLIGKQRYPHNVVRAKLDTMMHQPPARPTFRMGEALAALCARPTLANALDAKGWSRLLHQLYVPPPAERTICPPCPLCAKPMVPDHSTLCTNANVAAARTRRHTAILDLYDSLLAPVPTVITAREPHVAKQRAVADDKDRRADLRVIISGKHRYLADVKIVNENAQAYAHAPQDAAPRKQTTAHNSYVARTGRDDVRCWVFTVGGQLSSHVSTDLAFLAHEMGVVKEHLVATLYAAVLNVQADVEEAYSAAVSRLPQARRSLL